MDIIIIIIILLIVIGLYKKKYYLYNIINNIDININRLIYNINKMIGNINKNTNNNINNITCDKSNSNMSNSNMSDSNMSDSNMSDSNMSDSNMSDKDDINSEDIHQIIKKRKKNKKTKKQEEDLVYFDIGINGEYMGKIVMLLFSDIVPKTCNNFRTLCKNKNKLSYKGSPFHRIITDFMIQGGDYTMHNGSGGISIYGNKFEDENFELKHDEPYLLSMANRGPDTNGSQFFITTSETPHLDGKHVVFGKIINGFEIIDHLNTVDTNENDRPKDNIIIMNCGIYI
jgi:cyclophilin family peptidyl-prolyl cis-trans isomerase